VYIEAALAAASGLKYPATPIILDQAASFAGDAYVLTGKNDAVELGKRLSVLLRRAGIQSKRTGQPHMTLLYTKPHHAPREIEPIM
jgi:2'-5' RNA ligase